MPAPARPRTFPTSESFEHQAVRHLLTDAEHVLDAVQEQGLGLAHLLFPMPQQLDIEIHWSGEADEVLVGQLLPSRILSRRAPFVHRFGVNVIAFVQRLDETNTSRIDACSAKLCR